MSRRRRPRGNLRREVVVFLPVALIVLLVLCVFTLLSYRDAVQQLTAERRLEAERVARRSAEAVPRGSLPSPAALRRIAPTARAVALIDAAGRQLVVAGTFDDSNLLGPLDGRFPPQTTSVVTSSVFPQATNSPAAISVNSSGIGRPSPPTARIRNKPR